ncbi:hypothetical protein Tco_0068359, partial [Tanacetum coccineum]
FLERKGNNVSRSIPLGHGYSSVASESVFSTNFEEDVFDDEVQRNEAIQLSDEEIALDASSESTLSPRGPRYDYMMSIEAEDE